MHIVLFAFFWFSVLSVLSFLFFLFFSHQSLTRRPMPTQVERSSALIFDHTPKCSSMRSFSSSLLSYSFFDLAGASKSASSNDGSLLETIRSGSSVVGVGNSFVGSSFFIWKLFFFPSWGIINKYEWSFEFGVMSCFRWC